MFKTPPNLKMWELLKAVAQELAEGAFKGAIDSQDCVSSLKTSHSLLT